MIGDEDPREFEALREGLQRDWQPDTALESELVEQLAGIFWRLRRVLTIEAAIVKAREAEAYASVRSDVESGASGRPVTKRSSAARRHSAARRSLSAQYTTARTLRDMCNTEIRCSKKKKKLETVKLRYLNRRMNNTKRQGRVSWSC